MAFLGELVQSYISISKYFASAMRSHETYLKKAETILFEVNCLFKKFLSERHVDREGGKEKVVRLYFIKCLFLSFKGWGLYKSLHIKYSAK